MVCEFIPHLPQFRPPREALGQVPKRAKTSQVLLLMQGDKRGEGTRDLYVRVVNTSGASDALQQGQ